MQIITAHEPASLVTVAAFPPLDGKDSPIFGCDFTALSSAPFGDIFRFKVNELNLGSDRGAVEHCIKKLLPVGEGVRHIIVKQGMGSFIVVRRPSDDRDDDVVASIVVHWVSERFDSVGEEPTTSWTTGPVAGSA
ncbi:hypothetical protein [Ahrensia sp. R2A130]|uniref:hypothetical protein n=1 Tax=Ahrensia sp. R2A130 TaxID=744979 RepID=UPI0001E0BCB9|nr:hypothetical protein [Ahrensia sp. R2A130]EFL88321.1 conserved hypothetical protein [Ahrensia sp. R2A130]